MFTLPTLTSSPPFLLDQFSNKHKQQVYSSLDPPGGKPPSAKSFFISCLAIPVVIFFWAGGFIWKRTGWLRVDQIDVVSNRRELDWDEINAFRAEMATWPAWKRVLHHFF